MSVTPGAQKLGTHQGMGRVKYAVGEYDFAIDGGLVGDIVLRGDSIPSGAIIVDALLKVVTPLGSGGAATVALKTEGAADINAAAAFDGAPWSTAGAKRTTFVATTAPITTTAARTPTATVAVAALTAGAFKVIVAYMEVA